jgi:hypothetical protein
LLVQFKINAKDDKALLTDEDFAEIEAFANNASLATV